MHRSRFLALVSAVLATGLAACQAPGAPTGPSATPAEASAVPSVDVGATAPPAQSTQPPAASPSPAGFAVISGKVYDDNGALMRDAVVTLTANGRPEIAQTVPASGGTYVAQVPAGVRVTITATQAKHTSRSRTIQTEANGQALVAYTLDFGGEQGAALYALSKNLEIVDTTPANQARDVATGPLTIKFRFSQPLDRTSQIRFEELLEVRFQLSGATRVLRTGTLYDNETPTITWLPDGTEATFQFGAPIVTAGAADTAVTVGMRENTPLDIWPVSVNGDRLGGELSPTTADATGATVTQQMAPFFREPMPNPLATNRPSAPLMWGLTHRTAVTFTLARDEKKPRVTKVTAIKGVNGEKDRIDVEFDKPMRGFPKELLDKAVMQASNYRYVLGKTTEQTDIDKFDQTDPKNGSVTSEALSFSTSKTNVVQIPLPSGTLAGYTRLKLYVDPAVKDIAGIGIQTSAQDSNTTLADHIVLGGFN